MEDYKNNEEKDQGKKIIIFIILIIIILLLITSCSCTSKFFGKLGDSLSDSINSLFKNEEDYSIDDDTNDEETITNKQLKFDTSHLEMSLSDEDAKISYSYENINPKKFTCSTSDASIATCYVKDGYVVIKPKSVGTVTVILQTKTNGKIYEATAKVTVTDSVKSIQLSSKGGILNLRDGNQKIVSYSLIGLTGDISVTSSNPSVATAVASNGQLIITAAKTGSTTITLSITYKGVKYTATYNLSVINKESSKKPNNGGNNNSGGTQSSGSNSGNSNPSSNPGNNKPNNNPNPGTNPPSTNIEDYKLSTPKEKYNMSFINGHGERNIILYTNLFANQDIVSFLSSNNKEIQICSKDKKNCVTLTVDSEHDGGNIELEYTGNTSEPSSLPFKIKAGSVGQSIIHVSGTVSGKKIAEFNITINVEEKYIVTIDANGGMFNEFTKEYEFQLAPGEKLDLSKYDEPIKINDEECKSYKFKGYSKTIDGTIEYDRDTKNIIQNLDSDLTLYAIYETEGEQLKEEDLTKTLWSKNAELFHNEEYYQQYKKDKIIYPGAKGIYKMNFKNESSEKITITGLTLKEDTICIKDKGCLNMGYIIKYSPSESNNWTYYYGNKNDEYWILHSTTGTEQLSDQSFQTKIKFKDNEKISMKPGEEIVISVFWKWEEKNDDLDTLIGNQSAEATYNENLNDKYSLSIGIDFTKEMKACTK